VEDCKIEDDKDDDNDTKRFSSQSKKRTPSNQDREKKLLLDDLTLVEAKKELHQIKTAKTNALRRLKSIKGFSIQSKEGTISNQDREKIL